jgi:L-methionine (R)-S-oxide reductase
MSLEMNETDSLLQELEALLTGFWLTDLANFSAFFYDRIPDLNWIGFYLSDGKKLCLGPFMGKPACVEIALNRGVCGAAFTENKSWIVKDVHEFPGHISCDPVSQSELVIPFAVNGKLLGVLDVDSPLKDRFTTLEQLLLTRALGILSTKNPDFKGL